MSHPFGNLASESDLFAHPNSVVSPRCIPHPVVVSVGSLQPSPTRFSHVPVGGGWSQSLPHQATPNSKLDCESSSLTLTASSPGLSDHFSDVEDDISPENQEVPELYLFFQFLHSNTPLLIRLLKSSRRSAFISKNADIRFVALHLMFRFVSANVGPFTGGTRTQGILVAACLSLAAKYCEQRAYLPTIIHETGLDRSANVNVSDVVDKEVEVLKVVGFCVDVPRYWEALVCVALDTPSTPEKAAKSRHAQANYVTKEQQHRIYYAAAFADSILCGVARNPIVAQRIFEMKTDEIGLGASIAVAAGLTDAEAAVSSIFTPFALRENTTMALTEHIAAIYARCVELVAEWFSEIVPVEKS